MANKQVSLKKNFIMNAILTMSSFIFPIITFPYVSRVLLPAGYGRVQFAISFVAYFSMFAQLGIPTYGVRVCATVRDDREKLTRTAHELLFISLVADLIAYAALGIALVFVPKLQEDRLLFLIISASILLTSIGMEWLYKALEQYSYITIRSVIFKAVALAAMFLLVHEQKDYVIYGGISIFAASASNIFNLINAHKYIGFRSVGEYDWKRHLKPIFVFFAMACATTVYTNLDNVMLGFMTTDADVGYYGAAVKIKTILVSVITSMGIVILPRASYYVEKGMMEEFRRINNKALNFVFLAAAPITVYFILFARYGIFLLSGPEYAGAVLPMQCIMPTVLLIGITNILGIEILIPTGREKIVLYSVIAGAVTDVIVNAALIPAMRSTGAAIGTLAAETVVLIVQYLVLHKEVSDSFKSIHYLRILIAIVIGSVASVWVIWLGLGNFMTLLLSALLFFGVYGIIMICCKEEMVLEVVRILLAKVKRK